MVQWGYDNVRGTTVSELGNPQKNHEQFRPRRQGQGLAIFQDHSLKRQATHAVTFWNLNRIVREPGSNGLF
jgi:hypothetical protein